MFWLSSADFFKINFFKILFQKHYQCVKQFGSRSGPAFCWSWSGSKIFAKVISWLQKSQLARKEFTIWLALLTTISYGSMSLSLSGSLSWSSDILIAWMLESGRSPFDWSSSSSSSPPPGELHLGGDGIKTLLRRVLGLSERIMACLQAKLTTLS